MYERVQGEEAAFCHGKATIKPWESHGVEALSELHRTYGAWVDLVAKTKVLNDRGPISKITVAVSRPEGVFAAQVDPAPAMRFMPTAPGPADLPHTFHGVEEASVESDDSFKMVQEFAELKRQDVKVSGADTTCYFYIDLSMKQRQANLWPDILQSQEMPARLPRSPLRNYNMLAMGFDWEKMAHHASGVGTHRPDLTPKDPDLTLTGSYK